MPLLVPEPMPEVVPLLAIVAVAVVLLLVGVCALIIIVRRNHAKQYQADLREREQRLRLALWATGEFYWEFNLEQQEISWLLGEVRSQENPSAPAIASKRDQATIDITELVHPEDARRAQAALETYLSGKTQTFEVELRIQRTVGWRWVRARGRAVAYDAASRVTRIAGTALDISDTHTIEREHKIASQVLSSMAEAVAVLDEELNFVSVNPAFLRMTGHERNEIIAQNMRLLTTDQSSPSPYEDIDQALRKSGQWSGEIQQRRKNGQTILCTVEFSTIAADAHSHLLRVAVFNDITQQKRAEQQLHYLTNFDPLTNLPNRTLLTERLSLSIIRARRRRKKVAILFLDLDRFRDINEQVGPSIGDRILCAVAQRLQNIVGLGQTVARLGGDEFAVILTNFADNSTPEMMAQQILAAFDTPLALSEHLNLSVFFAIGISLYPDHALGADELLKQADIAMYQAKASGRRTFLRYDHKMDSKSRQRTAISSTLRQVLERSELTLAFQPRLDLASSRITSVEVLLRWFSREHGEINPEDFIPLAEESGMIMEISKWAMNEACLTLQDWRRQGLSELMMSVNVSLLQLLRDDFPEMVRDILHNADIPPQALELELTESMLMSDTEQTAGKLQVFREMGVSVAVDDFGTGYSSLAYLKQLPVNTIKIDKAFIRDLPRDLEDATIATSIISMGHSLGLKVVAEGVETDAQRQFLLEHACDEIQGFWLAKPMPTEQALAFIRNWSPEIIPPPPANSAIDHALIL